MPYRMAVKMIDYTLIGARIKQVRKENGITQEMLAERLHVSVGFISQIERGITKVNLETLGKISAVTGTDISYFVSGISTSEKDFAVSEISKLIYELDGKEREILLNQVKSYLELKKRQMSNLKSE